MSAGSWRCLVLPPRYSSLPPGHKRKPRRCRVPSGKSSTMNGIPVFDTTGCQVFDDGAFSEDDTLLLSDWLAHVPKEVLAKNFQVSQDAFQDLPSKQLYIFPGLTPPPINQDMITAPNGQTPNPLSFPWSKSPAAQFTGGSVKVLDSTVFNVSKTIAAALVTVEVGGLRELHVSINCVGQWMPVIDSRFSFSGILLKVM